MRDLADYFPLIVPALPGCPRQTVFEALSSTIADFAAKTHLLRDCKLPLVVSAGQCVVSVKPSSGQTEHILWVMIDGIALRPVDQREMPPEQIDLVGRPTRFWLTQDNCIQLHPCPDVDYTGCTSVVTKPNREEEFNDSGFFETWADAIASGVIARLTLIPGQPWSSPELMTYHARQYAFATYNARIRDRRTAPMRVKPQRFE